jgi:hypothetical protein
VVLIKVVEYVYEAQLKKIIVEQKKVHGKHKKVKSSTVEVDNRIYLTKKKFIVKIYRLHIFRIIKT